MMLNVKSVSMLRLIVLLLYHAQLPVAQATEPGLDLGRCDPIGLNSVQACCPRAELCQGEPLGPKARGFEVSQLDLHPYLLGEIIISHPHRRCMGYVAG